MPGWVTRVRFVGLFARGPGVGEGASGSFDHFASDGALAAGSAVGLLGGDLAVQGLVHILWEAAHEVARGSIVAGDEGVGGAGGLGNATAELGGFLPHDLLRDIKSSSR